MKNLIPNIAEIIPYTYDCLKVDGFEEIIEGFLADKPSVEHPCLVHMLGIPASGKSTFYQNNKDNKYKDFVFVSFDFVMEAHPQYHKDVNTLGSIEAFAKWELPARIAGYELLRRAVELKKNIFFDHSGAPKCHQELLQNVKNLGYKTEMYYIYCSPEVAIERAKARELITKRHTPQKLIIERVEMVEKNKEIYKKIVDVFVEVR